MINFEALAGAEQEKPESDLLKLFASLDVKGTHTEPRSAQREAMQELTDRSGEKDLVLKVSTGAGKTTVGLLYLLSHMKRTRSPVVYLCPTLQLVEQVLTEASKLGIQAYHYARNEKYPNPACIQGQAITVCSYEKLFNAKTTFMRHDVNLIPKAIVLDDAHAGSEIVRKQFTLQIFGEAYADLKEILRAKCRHFHPTRWDDIENNDQPSLFEVPHWIWSDVAEEARSQLHKYSDTEDFRFNWPLIEETLKVCRCVIARDRAEISAEILPIEIIKPYHLSDHRLFMSATLADDSLLVKEMGISIEAATKPIMPPSDQGLGERMILAPALIDPSLDRDYLIALCGSLASRHNVVVLTSSESAGRDWESAGAQVFIKDRVSDAVKELKNTTSGLSFAVFPQRYDGVDLADDACRVLVLDGVPYGESLSDKVDASMLVTPGGVRNRTVFRIEQGMGRAVRSHADYAVVLLVGQDLATFVGRNDVLQSMTNETRAQIELSIELANLVRSSTTDYKSSLSQVINQCLLRDNGWKLYYNKKIRSLANPLKAPNLQRATLADAERKSFLMTSSNNALEAIPLLRAAINQAAVDGEELGIMLQKVSKLCYQVDQSESMRIQQAARDACRNVALPPAAAKKPVLVGAKESAARICSWLCGFANPNAAVLEAERLKSELDFDQKFRVVEAAIAKLGLMLGAETYRPEIDFSKGPDVIWLWNGKLYVIEVKSENKESLHKSDSGQLHDSLEWAKTNYPEYAERIVPVVAAKVSKVDHDAHYSHGTRILSPEACQSLVAGLNNMFLKLSKQGPLFFTPDYVSPMLQEFGIAEIQFTGHHTLALKK